MPRTLQPWSLPFDYPPAFRTAWTTADVSTVCRIFAGRGGDPRWLAALAFHAWEAPTTDDPGARRTGVRVKVLAARNAVRQWHAELFGAAAMRPSKQKAFGRAVQRAASKMAIPFLQAWSLERSLHGVLEELDAVIETQHGRRGNPLQGSLESVVVASLLAAIVERIGPSPHRFAHVLVLMQAVAPARFAKATPETIRARARSVRPAEVTRFTHHVRQQVLPAI